MKILSIDIGILNLGFSFCKVSFPEHFTGSKYKCLLSNQEYKFNHNVVVMDCGRVNITHMRHSTVCREKCTLHHTRCVPDYLDHFIQEHQTLFRESDLILLEQQPPQGIMNVQDLLFTKFRDKILFVSPSSVHCFFKMSSEYLERKQESELIANPYLEQFIQYTFNERKHDISDSLLLVLYYYKITLDQLILKYSFLPSFSDFEQFRFTCTQSL